MQRRSKPKLSPGCSALQHASSQVYSQKMTKICEAMACGILNCRALYYEEGGGGDLCMPPSMIRSLLLTYACSNHVEGYMHTRTCMLVEACRGEGRLPAGRRGASVRIGVCFRKHTQEFDYRHSLHQDMQKGFQHYVIQVWGLTRGLRGTLKILVQ